MINEANAILDHRTCQALIASYYSARGDLCATELHMPNRKIADVVRLAIHGTVHVIEVKTDLRPTHLDEATAYYGDFCHYLWVAVPITHQVPAAILEPCLRFGAAADDIGILAAGPHGLTTIRPARYRGERPLFTMLTRALLHDRLTAGERKPGSLTATAAVAAQKRSAGPRDRRFKG